jgi:hypothetical protein
VTRGAKRGQERKGVIPNPGQERKGVIPNPGRNLGVLGSIEFGVFWSVFQVERVGDFRCRERFTPAVDADPAGRRHRERRQLPPDASMIPIAVFREREGVKGGSDRVYPR